MINHKEASDLYEGRRFVLQGQFNISTQELCDAMVEAETATKRLSEKEQNKEKEILSRTTLKVRRIIKKRLGMKARAILIVLYSRY